MAIVGASAAVCALEHDVDHTGNGGGTILRRRTVTQYLDAGDGAAGDGIEIDRRGTAAKAAVDVDDGGGMPAFAIDQYQRLVGGQTPQLRRTHKIGRESCRARGCQYV